MIKRFFPSLLTSTLLVFALTDQAEAQASTPNAVVKCGAFSGMKDRPGWETPAVYKIEGNKITFERVLSGSDETQSWSGIKGQSGHVMLVGQGGNKSGQ
jgi:hypothetical protein